MFFLYRRKQGFTLIELLVVIAIIGILASVVLASLNSAREKSRDAVRKSDLHQIQNALEMYYFDHFAYPTPTDGYILRDSGPLNTQLAGNGYINPIPLDPSGTTYYMYAVSGFNWTLWARLENPTAADTATLDTCSLNTYDPTTYPSAGMNYCISN